MNINKNSKVLTSIICSALAIAACSDGDSNDESSATVETEGTSDSLATEGSISFQMDAWSDNWFAAYLEDELIIEDSVSIDTERSFNSESVLFNADYPLQLNFILKDYKQNDTGLEYIGEPNQQMGDGGFIMQLTDTSTGEVTGISSSDWACTVIHEAPLDKSCESETNPVAGLVPCEFISSVEPAGWKTIGFDQSDWTATTVHTAAAVGPKDGYDSIAWDPRAEFIWGPDLETDNTVLCRVSVDVR